MRLADESQLRLNASNSLVNLVKSALSRSVPSLDLVVKLDAIALESF